jgi:hypothetical protein
MKYTSKADETTTTSVFHAAMYTLPPDLAGQCESDNSQASYPACTNHYPHIPSDITILRCGKIQVRDYLFRKMKHVLLASILFFRIFLLIKIFRLVLTEQDLNRTGFVR